MLNKFCGLINSCRHRYPHTYLLLLSLGKIERDQRRIRTAIFFRTKLDPFIDILLDNGILTVSEQYLSELLKELLQQIRHESPEQFLLEIKKVSKNQRKGFLQLRYYLTVTVRRKIQSKTPQGKLAD